MSYATVLAKVKTTIAAVSGINAVVVGAPASVQTTPMVFLLFDSYTREDDEQSFDDRATT